MLPAALQPQTLLSAVSSQPLALFLIVSMYPYIDSHCHFDFPDFDRDRAQVWKRCGEIGVNTLIIPAVQPDLWPGARQISEEYSGIYYSAGLHPWFLNKWYVDKGCVGKDEGGKDEVEKEGAENDGRDLAERIDIEIQHANCVAVGECGLDKSISTPLQRQLVYFEEQLKVAAELRKPVIIHSVKAHNEVIRLLKQYRPPAGGVIHAFSGSFEIAKTYSELGFYLGIGGVITYPRARLTRSAVRQLPLQALVLETDAPDMPLSGRQGQRNSPVHIPDIAAELAELRDEPLSQIAFQTSANTCQLFALQL